MTDDDTDSDLYELIGYPDDYSPEERKHDLEQSMKRIRRQQAVDNFARKEAKELIEWSKLPEWVKADWVGDNHYSRFDMDWEGVEPYEQPDLGYELREDIPF